jgi:hypothetical protein
MDTEKNEIQKYYMDLLFCAFLIVLLGVFFFAATDYSSASRRAPLVVMIPMALMVLGLTWATIAKIRRTKSASTLGTVLKEMDPDALSRGAIILLWLFLLLLFFYFAGHLGGTALFLLIFIRFVSKESTRTAVLVAVGVTIAIYILFERVLMISLNEGWIYHMVTGWLYS